jgi:2-dehydro-3-deoxygalactonokinase
MAGTGRIIVDWGTSNFRAFRFGPDGDILERRQAPAGILSVTDSAFEATLLRETGDWIGTNSEVWLAGMITSRNGWVETPYLEAPATLEGLAMGAVTRPGPKGSTLRFLPGVCLRSPLPDVMRGEEIQVFGAVGPTCSATLVLPGTHSKWVLAKKGALADFRSFMTGEVFAALSKHTILGRLIPADPAPFNRTAFEAGVMLAAEASGGAAGLLNAIFTTRSGVLLEAFAAGEIADRLSGILIGSEIAGAARLGWIDGPVMLIGDAALCARYRAAFEALGHVALDGPAEPTVEGFRRLARLEGVMP